jgi:hypothetical protein
MSLSFSTSARAGVHGQMKLARLLEMPERELEKKIRELEGGELFRRLMGLGVLTVAPYAQARFAARRAAGRELAASAEGLPELLDGRGDLAALIEKVGAERFQECFLGDEALSEAERARRCGLSTEDAARLRAYVDKLYVQEELAGAAAPAPAKTFSAVAGVAVSGGKPALGFFNREIWKGRYRVDEAKKRALTAEDARRAEKLLKELSFVDQRKSTLLLVLEAVLAAQAEYFVSRDPGRRKPLAQNSVAKDLGISPSVLNRLISNKCIELPWGLEAPLRDLFPSAKALLRGRLFDLAKDRAGASDEELRRALAREFGAKLSRRSVAQYRKELGLASRGRR